MAELRCFNPSCHAQYAITDVLYNCRSCGGLLEAVYEVQLDSAALVNIFRRRRMNNDPIDVSGV